MKRLTVAKIMRASLTLSILFCVRSLRVRYQDSVLEFTRLVPKPPYPVRIQHRVLPARSFSRLDSRRIDDAARQAILRKLTVQL